MGKDQYKSYTQEPTIHSVNVFLLSDLRRLFHISCENCKHEHKCHDIEHKRDNCVVSKAAEKLIGPFVRATVSGFVSEEFYIDGKYSSFKDKENFKNIFKFLRMKHVKKNAR